VDALGDLDSQLTSHETSSSSARSQDVFRPPLPKTAWEPRVLAMRIERQLDLGNHNHLGAECGDYTPKSISKCVSHFEVSPR